MASPSPNDVEALSTCIDELEQLLDEQEQHYWSTQLRKAEVWIRHGDYPGILKFLEALERATYQSTDVKDRDRLVYLLKEIREQVLRLDERFGERGLRRWLRSVSYFDGPPFLQRNPGFVAAMLAVVAVYVFFYVLKAVRPMDEEGYMVWSGTVRYQTLAGNTGSIDVPPGRGVYEVQLQTGVIVNAYTMQEGGHALGSCVKVREQRRPTDARPKFRIVAEADDC